MGPYLPIAREPSPKCEYLSWHIRPHPFLFKKEGVGLGLKLACLYTLNRRA